MAKTLCLFNHKGGVSKTTTSFNLGWSLAEANQKVLLVDLDSQCNLTGLILGTEAIDDDAIREFYQSRDNLTLKQIIDAVMNGISADEFMRNEKSKPFQTKHKNLSLLAGHLEAAEIDSQISVALKIASGVPVTRNIPINFISILQKIANQLNIDYMIFDLSPNVSGLNEIALMSSDYFIVPTSPDYFCLQAVGSLKKHIIKWHREINKFIEDNDFDKSSFPIKNKPLFLGIIQQRYRPRNEKPARSFQQWIDIIRKSINEELVPSLNSIGCVINENKINEVLQGTELSPYDLAHVSDFNSLIAISQELSKPIYAISDEELSKKVFGHAKNTMIENRDNFRYIFGELADRILKLTS